MMMLLSRRSIQKGMSLLVPAMLALAIGILIFSGRSLAANIVFSGTQEPEKLELVSGKSVILKSPKSVKRVSIAAPEIADFVLLSPQEIYVIGKAAGTTNMILWQNKKGFAIYDLEVSYDVSRLKQSLHKLLPNERDLRVIATHDSITLSGKVSSTTSLSQAMTLAQAYAPKGKVHNLLEVGGLHQVMLEVRVAEMARSLTKRLGINFNYIKGTEFIVSSLGGLTDFSWADTLEKLSTPYGDYLTSSTEYKVGISEAVNSLFRLKSGSGSWTGFIDALKANGLIKVLAEPTLIALSGQSATFLAGGEFPVPWADSLGTGGVKFKPFGVSLAFTPTVLSEEKIRIKVAPEVSELDFATAVRFGGYVVPGLSTRKAATVIELADGQSFAIAGLIKETVRDQVSKFPLLGDIPILGALFRSHAFQKNETELIIIATIHLVKPLDKEKQPLPTDYYNEPDDTEFYLLGLMEGREKNPVSTVRGKLEGEFGHAMPKRD